MNRIKFSPILLLLLVLPLYGENVVGSLSGLLTLENEGDTSTVQVDLEDLAAVDYLYDNPFVQGVELIFEQTALTKSYRNSFALYLYRSVQPEPDINQSQYRGNQFFMQILPYSSEFTLKIPFTDNHSIRKDADTLVTAPVSLDDFPLLMTMLPISKGLPQNARNAALIISARPVYTNMGGLKIYIEDEAVSVDDLSLWIDGSHRSWEKDFYTLEAGFHTVLIQSRAGNKREFNIAVEAGKFTEIHHTPETSAPRLVFPPMEGFTYYLDDKEIGIEELGKPIECEPGEHRVGIKLNEYITLSENYTLSSGELFTISLDTRILLEKD
ncbi:MAG: hypothetical protein PQJ59_07345 [Spirochaetales bacterium]|nr:hypothetical protein [Spirochaetales bacterium]